MTVNLVWVALLLFFCAGRTFADDTYYVGPTYGIMTHTQSSGIPERATDSAYGAEGDLIWGKWVLGANYTYFSPGDEGPDSLRLHQSNHWLSAEGKFRFWDQDVSPYVLAGLGAVFQSVTTEVQGKSDTGRGTSFETHLGLGMLIHLGDSVGLNLAAKYYQFSNISGFDYVLSLGVYPRWL